MTVFAVAIAAGDIIKYQSFVYGSFVWGIHVRYNNRIYTDLFYDICSLNDLELVWKYVDWVLEIGYKLTCSMIMIFAG